MVDKTVTVKFDGQSKAVTAHVSVTYSGQSADDTTDYNTLAREEAESLFESADKYAHQKTLMKQR